MLSMNYEGTAYEFVRIRGEGHWILDNKIVHLELGNELTKEARSRDLPELHNFSRTPPKPVKEKRERRKSQRRQGRRKSNTAVRISLV